MHCSPMQLLCGNVVHLALEAANHHFCLPLLNVQAPSYLKETTCEDRLGGLVYTGSYSGTAIPD